MRFFTLAALFLCFITPVSFAEDKKESVFDRVMKTNTLRCGYYVFPPVTKRDPNTGELSGFSVDMMNSIGKQSGLKIEWTEEVTFGNWAPALQADRFDAVCTPMWPEIPMARAAAFSTPMFYAGLSPMVRADNEKLANAPLDRFNKEDVTFLTQDGNAIDILTREAFPKAKINAMPASMDGPTVLQELITGKADAILLDRNGEIEYNRNNPVKLKLVAKDQPVKLQAFVLVMRRDEMTLKDFLDNAIRELQNSGSLDRMLTKWESEPDTFLRVETPVRTK